MNSLLHHLILHIAKPNNLSLLVSGTLICVAPVLAAQHPPQLIIEIEDSISVKQSKEQKKTTQEKKDTPTSDSRITLINGDQLGGTPQSIDSENQLSFTAESLREPVTFPLKNILTLTLNKWTQKKRSDTLARIKLQPRFRENQSDTILGTLKELTPENIKLETWYGGIITLKRSMVQSLSIINNNPGSYFGPNNINEWTLSEGKGTWQFSNGALLSRASGGVGRDVKLRNKSHIGFDASWGQSLRFRIQLYSNDVSTEQPKAFYDINFNQNYCFLRTYGNKQGGGGGRWQQIHLISGNKAHFDIYANRKKGTFNLYINGLRACLLQSQKPAPKELGTGISFVAQKNQPIEISNLTITPWNGTSLPNNEKTITQKENKDKDKQNNDTPNKPDKQTEKLPPHKIILNNGDEVPGTVGKVQNGQMMIETQYTPIHIPIKRIKSLKLGDHREEPKKYAGDIRAWFHQGGHITLKLKSLQNGKLSGYSQAIGDVTLDLSAFNRIDFQIYDPQANKLRAQLSTR